MSRPAPRCQEYVPRRWTTRSDCPNPATCTMLQRPFMNARPKRRAVCGVHLSMYVRVIQNADWLSAAERRERMLALDVKYLRKSR